MVWLVKEEIGSYGQDSRAFLMVIVYAVASRLGGLFTAILFGQYGLMLGLFAAPFGGSLLALSAAALAFDGQGVRSHKRDVIPPEIVWC
jgi:hypothetical protein